MRLILAPPDSSLVSTWSPEPSMHFSKSTPNCCTILVGKNQRGRRCWSEHKGRSLEKKKEPFTENIVLFEKFQATNSLMLTIIPKTEVTLLPKQTTLNIVHIHSRSNLDVSSYSHRDERQYTSFDPLYVHQNCCTIHMERFISPYLLCYSKSSFFCSECEKPGLLTSMKLSTLASLPWYLLTNQWSVTLSQPIGLEFMPLSICVETIKSQLAIKCSQTPRVQSNMASQ